MQHRRKPLNTKIPVWTTLLMKALEILHIRSRDTHDFRGRCFTSNIQMDRPFIKNYRSKFFPLFCYIQIFDFPTNFVHKSILITHAPWRPPVETPPHFTMQTTGIFFVKLHLSGEMWHKEEEILPAQGHKLVYETKMPKLNDCNKRYDDSTKRYNH